MTGKTADFDLPDKQRVLVGGLHPGLGVSYHIAQLAAAASKAGHQIQLVDGGVFSLPLSHSLPPQLVNCASRSAPQQIILLVHPADPAPLIQQMVNALTANFAPAQPQIAIRRAVTAAGMRHWQTRLLARLACQMLPETDPDHQRAARLLAACAAISQSAEQGGEQ